MTINHSTAGQSDRNCKMSTSPVLKRENSWLVRRQGVGEQGPGSSGRWRGRVQREKGRKKGRVTRALGKQQKGLRMLLAYLCLVLYFVGCLLKLANLSDNMGYLWERRRVYIFIFNFKNYYYYFFGCACGMGKFLGQGLNLLHSSDTG